MFLVLPKYHDAVKRSVDDMSIRKNRCDLWVGDLSDDGFPVVYLGLDHGQVRVIDALWSIGVGPIPKGYRIFNSCGNKKCVTKEHTYMEYVKTDKLMNCSEVVHIRHSKLPLKDLQKKHRISNKKIIDIKEGRKRLDRYYTM